MIVIYISISKGLSLFEHFDLAEILRFC